jgi:hypothetical protein
MDPERSGAVMVLAVNVVGDGAAHRDPFGAGDDRQEPPPGNDDVEDLRQRHARLTAQQPGVLQGDEPVEPGRDEESPAVVEAAVAVAPPAAVG